MHSRLFAAVAAVLLTAPAALRAADPATPAAAPAQPTPLQLWQRDDRNGDGKVEHAEFGGPAELFDRLDRNRDGVVTRDELPQAGGGNQPAPEAARQPAVPPDLERLADVVYGKGGDRDLALDILRPRQPPAAPMPVIVWIHGGAWLAGDRASGIGTLIPFARNGYFTATISYRLSQVATFPAQIHDGKCAIRFLRAHTALYHLDPGRIGVWGASAGGHLVALLGTSGGVADLEGSGGWPEQSSRVQAVCDWFGPSELLTMADPTSNTDHESATSPEGRLLGGALKDKADLARQASPVTYVTPDDPPFLIVHGTKDPTVVFRQSQVLYDALQRAGVTSTLLPIEGAGHGGPGFQTEAVRRQIADFFARHLRPVTPQPPAP